jgi:hypothetical protein
MQAFQPMISVLADVAKSRPFGQALRSKQPCHGHENQTQTLLSSRPIWGHIQTTNRDVHLQGPEAPEALFMVFI